MKQAVQLAHNLICSQQWHDTCLWNSFPFTYSQIGAFALHKERKKDGVKQRWATWKEELYLGIGFQVLPWALQGETQGLHHSMSASFLPRQHPQGLDSTVNDMWAEVKLGFHCVTGHPASSCPSKLSEWLLICLHADKHLSRQEKKLCRWWGKKKNHTSFSVFLRRIWHMRRQIKYANENAIKVFCYSCLCCYRDGSKKMRMKGLLGQKPGGGWDMSRQGVGRWECRVGWPEIVLTKGKKAAFQGLVKT